VLLLARGRIRLAPRAQRVLARRDPGIDLGELLGTADGLDVLVHEAPLLAAPIAAEAHAQDVVLDQHALPVDRLVPGRRLLLRDERTHLG